MSYGILATILSVLLTALFISVIFRRLNLPVILGYFIVGMLLGPQELSLIPDVNNIKELAEFGIVFLMFTVGLEFSQPRLFALRQAVFVIGGLQVLLSIAVTTFVGIMIGMTTLSALVVGGIVAMSSTAIVMKQLSDQIELRSPHGLNALGVLLFQDLAVIPFIILIGGLSKAGSHSLVYIFSWALLKGMLAILLITIAGRWLLRPLFHLIAHTRAMELFTLTVLLVTLTAAWLTNTLGLSYALGAFLAGIMLSETEFRHQIEIEIRPFRDILLGLFFITLGMLVDISHWNETWEWILLLFFAITFGKMALIIVISRLAGNNTSEALRTGLVLAQGSEFGFAILTLALMKAVIPADYGQVILAALVLSIAVAPIIIRFNKQIASFFTPKAIRLDDRQVRQQIAEKTNELTGHTIICGYGRVGQNIARLLDKASIPYIGLDADPELVESASLAGDRVIFGDASHPGILKAAKIDRAKALVISFNDLRASVRILGLVRASHPSLPVLVRCKDQAELTYLKQREATRVIAETYEESLTLSHQLLEIMELPTRMISEILQDVRNKDYDLLRKIFPGSFGEDSESDAMLYEQLRPIVLLKGAYAIGHNLNEFDFKHMGIELVGVRRGKLTPIKPNEDVILKENDILIAYGKIDALEQVEEILFEGP